jgi:ferredoxin
MTYTVRLINEKKGLDRTFQVREDQSILEVAEQQGLSLPYSCRTGVCSVCTGRLTEGTVNQDKGSILTEEQKEAGFIPDLYCPSPLRLHHPHRARIRAILEGCPRPSDLTDKRYLPSGMIAKACGVGDCHHVARSITSCVWESSVCSGEHGR